MTRSSPPSSPICAPPVSRRSPATNPTLSFGDDAVLVSGRLHPPEHKPAAQIGFGPGRGNVVAEMTLTRYAGGGKVPLLSFATDVQAGRKISAGNAQAVAARNTAIAATLAAENALPERLSPDVEAQARALGRAIAAKDGRLRQGARLAGEAGEPPRRRLRNRR